MILSVKVLEPCHQLSRRANLALTIVTIVILDPHYTHRLDHAITRTIIVFLVTFKMHVMKNFMLKDEISHISWGTIKMFRQKSN